MRQAIDALQFDPCSCTGPGHLKPCAKIMKENSRAHDADQLDP